MFKAYPRRTITLRSTPSRSTPTLSATALVSAVCLASEVQSQGLETLVVRGDQERVEAPLPGESTLSMEAQQVGMRIDSGELLQGLAGVQADSRSNYAQDTRVTLRGFGARSAFGVRGIDLQLDGIPLSTPDGQGQLSSLPVEEVANIQIVKGPLAALYGNGAGGVIRFNSRAPERNRVTTSIMAGEGDRQRQALTGEWREGAWGLRLQGSHFETDGERPHSRAERRNGGARLYHQSSGGVETVVRLDMSHDPLLQDPLGLSPEQWREDPKAGNDRADTFDTRKRIRHRQASVTLRQPQGEHRWQAAFWRGQREVDQWLAFPGSDITSSGAVIDLTRDFMGGRASYTRDLSLLGSPLETTFGVGVERMEDRRLGYVNDSGVAGERRRDELGTVDSRDVFVIGIWEPASDWEVTGGLRYSDLSFSVDDAFIVPAEGDQPANPDDSGGRDDAFVSAALGASYRINDQWQWFASAGRGYETPTLTEMAYRNEGTGLNTALEPAENRQWETGLRWGDSLVPLLELSVFQVDSDDELVVDRSVGGRTTYRNAAGTERRGIEASGRKALAPGLWARFSATYLDATYASGPWSGNQLPGIADTQLYGQLRWEPWQDESLGVALVGRYRSEVATGDDNAVFAPAATTWDLSVDSEHAWRSWRLAGWVKLENVADEAYVGSVIVNQDNGRSFEPAPGRQVSASVSLEYQW
ncbi:TonB-dependent receptor family protein [Marinimicrobium sp. ARAG 43.8]|uniref:TonB-dependent receptor family protein n=1 Tax=Marinimicrobium sp. ARAG 43.8 TaxID=3418719 RepID=UPI003CF4150A